MKARERDKPERVLDVEDIFYNHREVVATLRSGQTINLLDDDGRVVALITPLPKAIHKKPSRKPKANRLRTT